MKYISNTVTSHHETTIEGYDAFREAMADAAGTTANRVALHALHQHDAPACDFGAEKLLKQEGINPLCFDGSFARVVIERLRPAITNALQHPKPVTHIGWRVTKCMTFPKSDRIFQE